MRYTYLLLTMLVFSCSDSVRTDSTESEKEFTATANRLHNLYVNAGDCEERNSMIDPQIIFYENGSQFAYQDILAYCSYIQPKKPFRTFSKQYLVQPSVGFDFVDQYYINTNQDTLREVSSRIWEKKSNKWVITHMQVSRQATGVNL